ncbi:sigma-70 family RNA polymerase sigma factor [Hymenobacter sp. BT770]|uniref:RNA polymerase sigma factor n=1 Tax=Hymenobacter sp. BT770 TaxID=2886942 RepID=UPI001D0FDDC1|nr:sigma-70 family RNA polymerase sigma factor [Hymenobacter sp. BT770]MCC3155526.1 sigma-70 family RNA polymerase sigma factor [Hymenobacter sp. BT770]MDO3416582.1 sigma-70 family RNA polymerase sigma factor [Hymenobacter sp. BT770]
MTFVAGNTDPKPELSARAQHDVACIQAALAGQANAYEALLDRYRRSVYHVVLKMVHDPDDADDLTLEVFAKAFRSLACYRPEYAFSTWLFRIASNHSIDFVRRKKLHTQSIHQEVSTGTSEGFFLEVPAQDPDPQEAYIRQQRQELVQALVERLPPKYRRLVRLRYFEERSYDEIATETQAPLGTVKAQLFRARELLFELAKGRAAAL